jgi:hypothetical protein
MAWWYDEYGVDLNTGNSSPNLDKTGWLGQPLGPYSQWISPLSTPDASSNPGFETNVTTGWTFGSSIGASIVRDASTAMEGAASAHILCPTASPGVSWSTVFHTNNTILVQNGLQYSATFWARVTAPRKILLGAGVPGGGWDGFQWLQLETGWRRYQVSFVSMGTGNCQLIFHLSSETGDVWLDDVHLQAGVSSVYRRDFQNGTVLVNPSSDVQTVVLERPYGRIRGTVDPITNDGTWSANLTMPPNDALFLIGSDLTAPASIKDLHPVPPGAPSTRGSRATSDPR